MSHRRKNRGRGGGGGGRGCDALTYLNRALLYCMCHRLIVLGIKYMYDNTRQVGLVLICCKSSQHTKHC